MTGIQLRDSLAKSGTGETKIAVIDEILRGKDKMDATELLLEMSRAELPLGTMKKAKEFVDAAPVPAPAPVQSPAPQQQSQPEKVQNQQQQDKKK